MFSNFGLTMFGSVFVHWKTLDLGVGEGFGLNTSHSELRQKNVNVGEKKNVNRECPT